MNGSRYRILIPIAAKASHIRRIKNKGAHKISAVFVI